MPPCKCVLLKVFLKMFFNNDTKIRKKQKFVRNHSKIQKQGKSSLYAIQKKKQKNKSNMYLIYYILRQNTIL